MMLSDGTQKIVLTSKGETHEEGIFAVIAILCELNLDENNIKQKLKEKFNLSDEVARRYLELSKEKKEQ